MNITIVAETYPPEVNGVAMTLERIVKELARRGYCVSVIRPRQFQNDVSRKVGLAYHETVRGLPLPGYSGLKFGLPARNRLKQLWNSTRPDIVHVATEGPLGRSAINVSRRMGIPVVSSYHTNFDAYSKYYFGSVIRRATTQYLRGIHNNTSATFVPSEDLMQQLGDDGFRNLQLLGRGIDTESFSPDKRDSGLRNDWGANDNTPVVIYVGRVAKEKNLALTIKAYVAMKAILPEAKMVVVGDGPERERLQVENPSIHFAGMRYGEDLYRHYASGDVFLFASSTETFGNVLTEAMASGLLVLAFNYAAAKRYIRSKINGVTVPFAYEAEFVAAAQSLAIENHRWAAMRKEARSSVKNDSWDCIVDRYEECLAEVLNRTSVTCEEGFAFQSNQSRKRSKLSVPELTDTDAV